MQACRAHTLHMSVFYGLILWWFLFFSHAVDLIRMEVSSLSLYHPPNGWMVSTVVCLLPVSWLLVGMLYSCSDVLHTLLVLYDVSSM